MRQSTSRSMDPAETIRSGSAVLGVELGSTRIKATLIDPSFKPIAAGSHGWENKLENGVWTYAMEDVWKGLSSCMASLAADVRKSYGVTLSRPAAGGLSGMMHGYIAVDDNGGLLVPFRTWRNNITEEAATRLTELFAFPIAQRWSIAHLYQAILNEEDHVDRIAGITTLAGYVHWKLTGEWKLGMCEASGMFPVDPKTGTYDTAMLERFDEEVSSRGLRWNVADLLPAVVPAGEPAGSVTEEGAAVLDPEGRLEAGFPLAPPEGDAGTGMVATNSVRPRTGNVSAGTSAFAMVVLEDMLARVHPEIDIVLTPDGNSVAMAHSNNCTSDFDAWIALFGRAARALGADVAVEDVYAALMPLALNGDEDAGGLLTYGYVSGEHVTGFSEGRPMVVRRPDGSFTLENFVRAHLFSALGAMRTGLDILMKDEGVAVDEIRGHGGFFKTPEVGQRIMAAATGTPVSVLETAGEGGAWGMALLAAHTVETVEQGPKRSLSAFLDEVFAGSTGSKVGPDPRDQAGFETYFRRYTEGLPIEAEAVKRLR